MNGKYQKQNWIYFLQAVFISFACTVQFHNPLSIYDYEEKIDYYLAQTQELLGDYNFFSVLICLLVFGFLWWEGKREQNVKGISWGLATFFSTTIYVGKSFQETNSFAYCFGSFINGIKFVLACVGMTILLKRGIDSLLFGYEKLSQSSWKSSFTNWLFEKKCFLKVFGVLFLAWLPIVILSYPGNLCYDVIGQIEQGIGKVPYSSHHPLIHSVLIGAFVRLGNYDLGLFLYILFQAVLLAAALATTIWWLKKETFNKGKVSHAILIFLVGIYVFSPMYSNMVSTAIKDVPFMAMVIWYVVLLAEIWLHRERLKESKFIALFLLVQILMSLLRNNGFYVLFLTGLAISIAWWKEGNRKDKVRVFLFFFVIPVLCSKCINGAMVLGLSAEKGKVAEMLSLPFQQTARYLQLYRDELTENDRETIEAVLGDLDLVAASYDPDIADPVKRLYYYQEDVTTKEVFCYLEVWMKEFFSHPKVYVEAFFTHIYGWLDPMVKNAPRYEAESELFSKELFKNSDKVLLFLYRFAERFTPVNVLQNVGVYTWILLILTNYLWRKNRRVFVLLTPLLVSLLICFVSPCFYLHPRYAYPYMFTIPFYYGFAERSRK